jgi:DNA repair protein SbcD/Mre11
MQASFIHMADVHLGYEQYGVRERFNDFSRSFWEIVDEAIARKVNFVIVAGDLFNKRSLDALTLIHAIEGFRKLKDHAIPVIAIEGNHDRSYYRDGVSWLQFLCYQGYIQLLNPIMRDGIPQITPWDPTTMQGSYVDLLDGSLRIYGLPWQGASTLRSLEGMAASLQEARADEDRLGVSYRLLTMHTGVDGLVAHVHGLPTLSQFQPLHSSINYLALGHVHKPYEFDDWIYNPGSTENCGAEEAQWQDRGYYYVEVDTETRTHHATRLVNKRRSFVRYDIRIDTLTDPDQIYRHLEDYCHREGPRYKDEQAVVSIRLIGTFAFDAGALDQQRLEEMVQQYFTPLYVRIENTANDQDYAPDDNSFDGLDRTLWYELERHIFADLVGMDSRYLPAREQWSSVLSELKSSALRKEQPEQIARFLREKRTQLLS